MCKALFYWMLAKIKKRKLGRGDTSGISAHFAVDLWIPAEQPFPLSGECSA